MDIPVTFRSDAKGYFDRECPNQNCQYIFKVFMEDWKDKVSGEAVHCPMCGHTDTAENWWTQEQLSDLNNLVKEFAVAEIQRELNKIFRGLESSTRGNKFIKITYKPEKQISFINNPLGQSPEWERDVVCPKCKMRYSVIGTAFFCPCCGYNSVEDSLEESLDSIVKMIETLPEMENLYSRTYGNDKAITMCRSLVESSLGDVISAFQKFAEVRCNKFSSSKVRPNDFQIVDKGSCLFLKSTGRGYDAWLAEDELFFMSLMFQRRHVMEHNGGMIDEDYIRKSKDTAYVVGQRLIIREDDILHLISIIKKLTIGIKSLSTTA